MSEKDAVNLDYEAQLKGQSLRDLKLHGLLNAIHLANEDQLQGQSLGGQLIPAKEALTIGYEDQLMGQSVKYLKVAS